MKDLERRTLSYGDEKFSLLFREGGEKVLVLIHGNLSSSEIWHRLFSKIPHDYTVIAPDLCGFGYTNCKGIDATKGFTVFTEEVMTILRSLKVQRATFMGHSMGGGVVLDILARHPDMVTQAVLIDPMPPYGWGGVKGLEGEPCYPDYSGSGAGLIRVYNPFFLQVLEKLKNNVALTPEEKQLLDATISLYFAPGYKPSEDVQKDILEMIRRTSLGDEYYPGDYINSPNWPYVAPGTRGVLNAMSPKYFNAKSVLTLSVKPPVYWIHGSDDLMVSDNSPIDIGVLGKNGFIPNYPGEEIFPPQPMFSQIKAFLEEYTERGGSFEQKIIQGAGHTPFVEKEEEFLEILMSFIG
ncbi:MAG: alpha/beta fold hydrolase [Infirmifilum sp.]|uniref:alpha/beta fold hydrolase n=1 Tax=Infirmifilum TaxID=2856573 RepID=UPI003C7110F6